MTTMVTHRQSGDLPWGWWLRADRAALHDDEGRTWRSVRDAFWQGHLGFPDVHFAPEQHELLLRVLSAIDARWLGSEETQHDLFAGDMMFWRLYQCWLFSIGLLEATERHDPLHAPLSALGRSVLLMLRATREPAWEELPMQDVIDAVASARSADTDGWRERVLQAFERQVALRRHVFARERVGHLHVVTLTGISSAARMPTRRVMWSQTFADERVRYDLFAWLAQRVDRWDDWGQMAYGSGANALTKHLLMVLVATGSLS
jgi:hypothetical protein